MAVDAQLIQAIAREYVRLDVAPARAVEIAAEVMRLNDSVHAAAHGLAFDCRPSDFVPTLLALAAWKRK
jgi:hypothetical protein